MFNINYGGSPLNGPPPRPKLGLAAWASLAAGCPRACGVGHKHYFVNSVRDQCHVNSTT